MAHLQCTDVQDRHADVLDLTSVTLDEFQQLVPPFDAAFQAHKVAWCLDRKPRTARQFAIYKNCPCQHRKTGCSSCLRTGRRTASRWCRGARARHLPQHRAEQRRSHHGIEHLAL
jgi:hypothetical protein